MKLKKLLKNGGVADIVTLMIIIGIVIALIIAVVLPMVTQSKNRGSSNIDGAKDINSKIEVLDDPISIS